ncbi:MAG: diacylglycerol kinase family protein [bacterium]
MKPFLLINYGDRAHCDDATLRALEKAAREFSPDSEVALSRSLEESQRLVERAASEGFDRLIIGGGDGTFNSVLNQTRDLNFVLGILPLGTVNTFARSIGLTKPPVECLRALLGAQPVSLPLGEINGKRFGCMAGTGLDAAACHAITSRRKRFLGAMGFVLTGIEIAARRRAFPRLTVQIEDTHETLEGYHVILSNISNYGGITLFDGFEKSHAGTEMILLDRHGFWFLSRVSLSALLRGPALHRKTPGVHKRWVRSVRITAREPLEVHLDGEPVTLDTPNELRFTRLEGALRFLLPAKRNN